MENLMIIAGATGLVGSKLVEIAQADETVNHIHLLVRQQYPAQGKILTQIVDFQNIRFSPQPCEKSVAICCIGSTIKKAQTKEEFYKIDHDFPLKFAQAVFNAGIQHFIVISAIGANATSSVFYNSVKGKMEDDIKKIPFKSLHILRPSLLLGKRNEYRKGEEFAKKMLKPLSFLLPAKYKPVEASTLAEKIIEIFKNPENGIHIYEGNKILKNN